MENLINNTITYTFDIKIAKEYGVNEAIFISNMKYWIFKNIANNKNYFDGKHWTYNSKRAFLEIFPFWTEQTLKTTIKHLVERGVLVIGNYNKNPYDRTNWYAFVDETMWIDCNYPIDRLKLTNGEVNTNQPIPNNKPNNKPNKKEIDKEKDADATTALIERFVNRWNNGIASGYDVPKIRDVSDERRSKLLDRMKQAKSYYPDKDEVEAIFKVIANAFENSRFLRGENSARFKFGIDFVLQKSSFIKMYEGNYNDRE